MEIKTLKIILLLNTILLIQCYGQNNVGTTQKYVPLKVGDRVPEYELTNLINYHTKSAKISDFKGKLVVLDFWSTYCASCIASWPKLLSIQKEFNDKLQIILINSTQAESVVRPLFERTKKLKNLDVTLPAVCGDTIIKQLFPYTSVPHVAWIDEAGLVIAITDGTQVNSKNISALLNKEKVTLRPKIDNEDFIAIDWNKPLFINGNGGSIDEVISHSVLTKYPSQLEMGGISLLTNEKFSSVGLAGYGIRELYRLAYSDSKDLSGDIIMMPQSRVVLEVKDTSQYVTISNSEIQYSNLYVYQSIAPPTNPENLQKRMQDDLKRAFDLQVHWEKRKMKCLVLTADDTTQIRYKEGRRATLITDYGIILNKIPLTHLFYNLETATKYHYSPYPIIDNTGYKGRVGNINIEVDIYNLEALDKAFQKYKMRFKLEDREVDLLILTEPGYSEHSKE